MAKKRKIKKAKASIAPLTAGQLNRVIKTAHRSSEKDLQALLGTSERQIISELAKSDPDKYLAPYLLMARTMRTHSSIAMAIEQFDYHLAYMGIRAAGEEMLHLAYALHWPKDYLSRLRSQQQIFFYNLLRNFGQSDYYPPEQINQVLLSLYLKNKEELTGRAYATNNRYLRQCLEHLDGIVANRVKLNQAPSPEAVQKFLDALQSLHKLPAPIKSVAYYELSEQIGSGGTELLGRGISLRDILDKLKGEVGKEILPTIADCQNLLHLYNLVLSTANSILHVSAFSLQADPTSNLLAQLTGQSELTDAINKQTLATSRAPQLHDLETIEQSLKMLTTVLTLYRRSLPNDLLGWESTTPRKIFRQDYVKQIDKIISDYLMIQEQPIMIRSR